METANEQFSVSMENLASALGVPMFCSKGGHTFLSKDGYATCEPCRQRRKQLREQKNATSKPKLKEWVVKSEWEMEEVLKTLQRKSGYEFVMRTNKKTQTAPGKSGFYRSYACPRWNKSKLPVLPATSGLSTQEGSHTEQRSCSTLHSTIRHWLRKPRQGIGCGFALIAKTRKNGDIQVYQLREHSVECCPIKKPQLALQVEEWVRNLLQLGLSTFHIFEWSRIKPPEGHSECPKKPSDAACSYRWTPSLECIENVEFRMRRESYIHPDDKTAVCQLLEEWSGLSSGMQGHTAASVGGHHVLYWQNFECYCPVEGGGGGGGGGGRCCCSNSTNNCKPFFAVLQSPWQRELMMKEIEAGGGEVLGLDSSGQASSTRWILHALIMISKHNIGIPIGFALSSDEYSKVVALFLNAIASTSPPNYSPKVMMIDMKVVEIAGIAQSCWGKSVAIRVAYTRVMQAWLRWSRKMKLAHTKKILAVIRSIKWAASKDEVDGLVEAMQKWLEKEGNSCISNHFEKHYFSKTTAAGPIGNLWINALRSPVQLSEAFAESSNLCEGVFKALRHRFLDSKANERVEDLLKVITQRLGPYFQTKYAESEASCVKHWDTEGNGGEELARDIVDQNRVTIFDPTLGIGSIASAKDGALDYSVTLKPPSCTCPDVSNGFCKHIRALGRALGGLESWDIGFLFGREHSGDIRTVSEPLPLDTNEGGEFGVNDPRHGSLVVQPAVTNTANTEICRSFERVCSNGSMRVENISALDRTLKRIRGVYEDADADEFFACHNLIVESTKLEASEAVATWDEIGKILHNAKANPRRAFKTREQKAKKAKTISNGWPQESVPLARMENQDCPENRNGEELIQKIVEEAQGELPGDGMHIRNACIKDGGTVGVNKMVVTEGDGKTFPCFGQIVSVHYTGSLADNTKLESSRDDGSCLQFQIGMGKVIKGLDEGVMQMSVGERAVLECSPEYAYGASGIPDRVPPNSIIYFDVELMKTE